MQNILLSRFSSVNHLYFVIFQVSPVNLIQFYIFTLSIGQFHQLRAINVIEAGSVVDLAPDPNRSITKQN